MGDAAAQTAHTTPVGDAFTTAVYEFDCFPCVQGVLLPTTCDGRVRHPSEIRCPVCRTAPENGVRVRR